MTALDLTAVEAIDLIRAGELDPGALWEAYRQRAAGD